MRNTASGRYNVAAQAAYRSPGFKLVGDYATIRISPPAEPPAVVSCARMTNDAGLMRAPLASRSTTPLKRRTTSLVRACTPEDSASHVLPVSSGPVAEPPHKCKPRRSSVELTSARSLTTAMGGSAGGVLPDSSARATASLVLAAPPSASTYFFTSDSSPPGMRAKCRRKPALLSSDANEHRSSIALAVVA